MDFTRLDAGVDFLAGSCGLGGADDLAGGAVGRDGITTGKGLLRPKETEAFARSAGTMAKVLHLAAKMFAQLTLGFFQTVATLGEQAGGANAAEAGRDVLNGES